MNDEDDVEKEQHDVGNGVDGTGSDQGNREMLDVQDTPPVPQPLIVTPPQPQPLVLPQPTQLTQPDTQPPNTNTNPLIQEL